MTIHIHIYLDKKCAECRKPGAAPSGICMKCAAKAIKGVKMKSPEGRTVQARFNTHMKPWKPNE
jgi:hypothetical protein